MRDTRQEDKTYGIRDGRFNLAEGRYYSAYNYCLSTTSTNAASSSEEETKVKTLTSQFPKSYPLVRNVVINNKTCPFYFFVPANHPLEATVMRYDWRSATCVSPRLEWLVPAI
jgi:hypothetical protein